MSINNTLLLYYSITGQDKAAFMYAEKYNKYIAENPILSLQQTYRSAYAYKQVGRDQEAEFLFNRQIKYDTEALELGRYLSRFGAAHYDLAAVYAFLGDRAKAYEHLREFNKKHTYPLWWVTLIKNDPLFNSIRDEPEFLQIVRDVEAKYLTEHERVRLWLEENDLL
ncbi:MAG: hypothetical protein E4H10_10285 [Bacteroidia bacterium]|nr:MAG: hypothetical protein E4H10_10285 [Bacteroidia bacterium]